MSTRAGERFGVVSSFGEYFYTTPTAERFPADPPWVAMSELLVDERILTDRVDTTRRALAAAAGLPASEVERRVAASIAHLGVVARLVAPIAAVVIAFGEVPEVSLGSCWWRPVLGGPYPLSFDLPVAVPTGDGSHDVAVRFDERILGGPVAELDDAFARVAPLPEGLLAGNVASGLVGAARMVGVARPDLATSAAVFLGDVLSMSSLAGAGDYGPSGAFRRHSCCLMYRVPGSGYCGDCALR